MHLHVCCFLLLHLFFCGVVFLGVAIHFSWLIIFLTFRAPTFSPFPPSGFRCCTCLLWDFVTTMFLAFQGGSPMINGLSIVSRPPILLFTFVFTIRGGGAYL